MDKAVAVYSKKITVTTTAAAIEVGDGFKSLIIKNTTTTPVYVGGSDVDTTDGFEVGNTEECIGPSFSMNVAHGAVYVVAASSVDIKVFAGR